MPARVGTVGSNTKEKSESVMVKRAYVLSQMIATAVPLMSRIFGGEITTTHIGHINSSSYFSSTPSRTLTGTFSDAFILPFPFLLFLLGLGESSSSTEMTEDLVRFKEGMGAEDSKGMVTFVTRRFKLNGLVVTPARRREQWVNHPGNTRGLQLTIWACKRRLT